MRASTHLLCLAGASAALLCCPHGAAAQFAALGAANKNVSPITRDQPVAFTADNFEYDRTTGIVTATGHVEAWQGDHVLRADKVTFDRNTNVAAATGHVVLVEPDGQVLFSDYAELTQGMREGVLKGMRALLAENGKLAANGARRVDGKVNELTHAVYTTCNLCKTDPTKPPLWQLRAYSATQDLANKRIEYQDAILDMFGVPVFYLPYFSHADPSVRRASGFLVPGFGYSKHIGYFVDAPYYWAIDDQQDVTITPEFTSGSGGQLSADYRRRFNEGIIRADGGVAIDQGKPQGYIFARGSFDYDDTYRYGFNLNRASSTDYLRDFKVQNYSSVLTSSAYIEGFGVGAYTKLDAIAYQGLATTINQSKLPYVLPRYQYSFFGEPDALGGRFSFSTEDFNVLRESGTNTQRLESTLDWQRPFQGAFGERYNLRLHDDTAGYTATSLDQQPTYGTVSSTETARSQPSVSLDARWPFMRSTESSGTQVIEPIVQVIEAPNAGSFLRRNIPNEDSLDFEFTDANLFSINRFPGVDRFEGGLRANAGLHLSWTVGGTNIDTLVGQSYREHLDKSLPPLSGLNHHVSDIVARTTITPATWFDVTARTRVDQRNGDIRFGEVVTSAGAPLLRVSAGYLYSAYNPYFLYDANPSTNTATGGYPASFFVPRNEITLNAASQFGAYKFSGYVRRDLELGKFVSTGLRGTYEDECFIFDANFSRRFTSINNDGGGTTVLFTITFKSVGQFGFHAS